MSLSSLLKLMIALWAALGATTIVEANGFELIKRFEDKNILDLTRNSIEQRYTCDSTGINDLLETILPRLDLITNRIITRANDLNDQMYNKTMLKFTEEFSFGENKILKRFTSTLDSAKAICEVTEVGAGSPLPEPPEYIKFSQAIGKMGIDQQIMAAVEAGSDIVLLGSGKTLLGEKNKTHTFQYSTGVTTMGSSTFYVGSIAENLRRETTQLCLVPRKLEKTTKFHKEIMEKRAPTYVKLLRKLKENVLNYLTAEFTSKPLITTLKRDMIMPKVMYHLYECVNHFKLNEIIFDPNNNCFKHIKKILNYIIELNDLIHDRKPTIRIGYEQIGAQKVNNNTIILTIKKPDNIIGEIYEILQEGGGPLAALNYVIFKTDRSCFSIDGRPETSDNDVVIRKMNKLPNECCKGLLNNENVSKCQIKEEEKEYHQISPTMIIWAFYINITVSIISLATGLILMMKKLKKIYTNTDYYKIRKIREQKRKRNKRREIELAELGFDQETNFIRTRPTAPSPESEDSDYQVDLVSPYKRRKTELPKKSRKKKQKRRTEN